MTRPGSRLELSLRIQVLALTGWVGVLACGKDPAPVATPVAPVAPVAPVVTSRLAAIRLTPDAVELDRAGTTLTLVAAGLDGDGGPLPLGAVAWSSSEPQAVAVDGTGRVTVLRSGTVTVTATEDGVNGTATVTVAIPGAIQVEPARAAIAKADDRPRFVATVLSDAGTPLAGRAVSFSVADPQVATVDAAGVVTGVKDGSTFVTVTSGSLQAEVRVDVAGLVEARAPHRKVPPRKVVKKTGRRTRPRLDDGVERRLRRAAEAREAAARR